MQIDVGFGDALEAWDTEITMPTLLDFPAPRLRGFLLEPWEALVRGDAFTEEWPPGGPWQGMSDA